jgi:hypothetical protein
MSPLAVLASRANMDIQMMGNQIRGAVEYATSYATKPDEPAKDTMTNILIKYYIRKELDAETQTDASHYKAIGNSIIGATKISAPQACWFLLGMPFFKSSRRVVNLSGLRRDEISVPLNVSIEQLSQMQDNEPAIIQGPSSILGVRRAFAFFQNQQYTISQNTPSEITLFLFVQNFKVEWKKNIPSVKWAKYPAPDRRIGIKPDTKGLLVDWEYRKGFIIDDYYYTKYEKAVVVRVNPTIPFDEEEERSCYSNLLVHYPWDGSLQAEFHVTHPYESAVLAYKAKIESFPEYYMPTISRYSSKSNTKLYMIYDISYIEYLMSHISYHITKYHIPSTACINELISN